MVSPWGTFLSFNLQNSLYQASQLARSTNRSWWNRNKIMLSPIACGTISQLLETLVGEEFDTLWTRPIAFMLERTPTHTVFSDASYLGIGGWSPCLNFVWRSVRTDLEACGFNIQWSNACEQLGGSQEMDEEMALHINPLEFLGALINLWLSLILIKRRGPILGGYILALYSDNTTALSWMSLAARTKNPLLQGLACLGAGLLVQAHRLLTCVQPLHISGEQNGEADAISRPEARTNCIPPLSSVITQWCRLRRCQVYLLPLELMCCRR